MNKDKKDRILQMRESILRYANSQKNSPLKFGADGITETRTPPVMKKEYYVDRRGNIRLYDLVLDILKLSRGYSSIDVNTNKKETAPGKNRSWLDVWRHAKLILPKVDIFPVMEILYKIASSLEVESQYCFGVKRTVFYLESTDEYMSYLEEGELGDLECHEFDISISLSDWQLLHI